MKQSKILAKIIAIEAGEHRVGLSIKALAEDTGKKKITKKKADDASEEEGQTAMELDEDEEKSKKVAKKK